ncbi:MAG: NAD(P)H-dependent oxidoreductase subunit E, partial [Bacteroidota bacterium]
KRYAMVIDLNRCTGCGACVENCPTRNLVQPLSEEEIAGLQPIPEDKEAVIAIIARHTHRDGPLMPILQEISATFGYLPGEVLAYVAKETGYPLTHIYRIATFYNAFSFTPKARHTIYVCMGTACYIKGGGRIVETFEKRLAIQEGHVTPDLQFGIGRMYCFGCCGQAPVVVVNTTLHGHFKSRDVPTLIKSYAGGS